MAQLAYQQAKTTGQAVTMQAASGGGDTIPVAENGALLVRNGDASSKTVTVVVPGSQYGQARADIPVVVAAGATALIGPFPFDLADPITRVINVTYSAVTSVTVAAITI